MSKRPVKRKLIVLPIMAFIVTVILFAFGSRLMTESKRSKVVQINSGWTVCYGSTTLHNTTLSNLRLRNIKRGTVITVSNTLPRKNMLSYTVMFESKHATVDVQLDGRNVYSYGWREYDTKRLIPKNFHFVSTDEANKEIPITISFKVSEDSPYFNLHPVYYGTMHDLTKEFLEYHRLPLFVGAFMCIYSWLLFSLAIYMYFTRRTNLSMFFSSGVAMLLSLYTFTYNDIFALLGDNDLLFTILEYTTLFYIPFAVSVLLYTTHPEIASRKQRLLTVLNFFIPLIILLLHFLNISHIHTFIIPFQIIIIAEIALMLPALTKGLTKARKSKLASDTYTGVDADSYLLLGFIILIIFAFLEIAKYTILRITGYKGNFFTNINYLTLGMLYFIFCLFIYYFMYGIDLYNARYIKEQLEGLAYTDSLTGLMNRASSMQYLATVHGPFAMVSFDLDNLKYVNDTYGHTEGDNMIKDFAALLKKAFSDAQVISRMGGDEFIAFIEKPDSDICQKYTAALDDYIAEYNRTGRKFTMSVSYGYAYSSETRTGRVESVFILADSRMYEMKEKHHA